MRNVIVIVGVLLLLALLTGCVGDTAYSPSCPDPEVALGNWTAMLVGGRPAIIDTIIFSAGYYENREVTPDVAAYRGMLEYSVSFDTSYAGVKEYFGALTNGIDEQMSGRFRFPNGGQASVFDRESTGLRGGVTGNLHPDLMGCEVTKVTYHFIGLYFDHPGEDPNNDGIWTDYILAVNIEFWGHLEE